MCGNVGFNTTSIYTDGCLVVMEEKFVDNIGLVAGKFFTFNLRYFFTVYLFSCCDWSGPDRDVGNHPGLLPGEQNQQGQAVPEVPLNGDLVIE